MITLVPAPRELETGLAAAQPALRAYCARIGVPAQDRDDVLQEALARAWRSRERFQPERPLEPWLCTIALRVWIDLRARRAREVRSAEAPELAEAFDPRAEAPETRLDLERSLSTLRPLERDLLLLFHRDGFSLSDLADRFDLPLNTVKSHLRRARQRLQGQGWEGWL